jgi:hypothetical protein
MQLRVHGHDHTKGRLRQYLASNPAAREGWVSVDSPDRYWVHDAYVDPFKEIAANFGLVVTDAADPPAE